MNLPTPKQTFDPSRVFGSPRRFFSLAELIVAVVLTMIVGIAILPRYLTGREAALVSSAQFSMRTTAAALESYNTDHGVYPDCGAAVGQTRVYESQLIWHEVERTEIPAGVATINSFASKTSGAARLITFRIATKLDTPRGPNLAGLTTPVAYLARYLEDPFAHTRGASFGYFPHGSGLGWVLFSMGPDRDENARDGPGDMNSNIEQLYNINTDFPNMWQPPPMLQATRYDPTNGLFSGGDIWLLQGRW